MRSTVNRATTLLLVVLLLRVPSTASDAVRDSVSKRKPGSRIELVLSSDEKVTGRLGGVQPNGFTLKSDKRGGADRELRFDEVRSAKAKMTTARKRGDRRSRLRSACVNGAHPWKVTRTLFDTPAPSSPIAEQCDIGRQMGGLFCVHHL